MKKKVLKETFFICESLPSQANIQNDVLAQNINDSYIRIEHKQDKRFKDFHLQYQQNHTWLFQTINNEFSLNFNNTLNLISVRGQISRQNESTIKRNHIDLNDLKSSPDYTIIYFVKGNSGDLILEYDDHRVKNLYQSIPVKEGKYVLFNSSLNYYITENKNKDIRKHLIINCQKI
mgnify:CR=1|jgi:hypothetical protein